jgi:hypothetical protein
MAGKRSTAGVDETTGRSRCLITRQLLDHPVEAQGMIKLEEALLTEEAIAL